MAAALAEIDWLSACIVHLQGVQRRKMFNLFGAAAIAAAILVRNLRPILCAGPEEDVTVVRIAGIPWFNALENGLKKAGRDFGIDASVVGPAHLDAAQQVKLLEDLVAQKVDVIGLVPIDVKMAEPVLKRAQRPASPSITHEGPEQEGRTWNVELIDSMAFGEVQMQKLAKEMGEEGEYAVFVGSLTTPLHNIWADAAIAYQKANYPKMKLVADRFPGADEIDTALQNGARRDQDLPEPERHFSLRLQRPDRRWQRGSRERP